MYVPIKEGKSMIAWKSMTQKKIKKAFVKK